MRQCAVSGLSPLTGVGLSVLPRALSSFAPGLRPLHPDAPHGPVADRTTAGASSSDAAGPSVHSQRQPPVLLQPRRRGRRTPSQQGFSHRQARPIPQLPPPSTSSPASGISSTPQIPAQRLLHTATPAASSSSCPASSPRRPQLATPDKANHPVPKPAAAKYGKTSTGQAGSRSGKAAGWLAAKSRGKAAESSQAEIDTITNLPRYRYYDCGVELPPLLRSLPGMGRGAHPATDKELVQAVRKYTDNQLRSVADTIMKLMMLSTTSGPVQTFIFDTETASSPIPEDFKLGYLVRPVDICVIHTAPMSQASEHHSVEFQERHVFETLVKPGGKGIHPGCEKVHGITNEHVAKAPSCAAVSVALMLWIWQRCEHVGGATVVLGGHNVSFDLRYAAHMLMEAHLYLPPRWVGFDTLQLSERMFLLKEKRKSTARPEDGWAGTEFSLKLGDVARHQLKMTLPERLHRAKADALLTVDLIRGIMARQMKPGTSINQAVLLNFNLSSDNYKEPPVKVKYVDSVRESRLTKAEPGAGDKEHVQWVRTLYNEHQAWGEALGYPARMVADPVPKAKTKKGTGKPGRQSEDFSDSSDEEAEGWYGSYRGPFEGAYVPARAATAAASATAATTAGRVPEAGAWLLGPSPRRAQPAVEATASSAQSSQLPAQHAGTVQPAQPRTLVPASRTSTTTTSTAVAHAPLQAAPTARNTEVRQAAAGALTVGRVAGAQAQSLASTAGMSQFSLPAAPEVGSQAGTAAGMSPADAGAAGTASAQLQVPAAAASAPQQAAAPAATAPASAATRSASTATAAQNGVGEAMTAGIAGLVAGVSSMIDIASQNKATLSQLAAIVVPAFRAQRPAVAASRRASDSPRAVRSRTVPLPASPARSASPPIPSVAVQTVSTSAATLAPPADTTGAMPAPKKVTRTRRRSSVPQQEPLSASVDTNTSPQAPAVAASQASSGSDASGSHSGSEAAAGSAVAEPAQEPGASAPAPRGEAKKRTRRKAASVTPPSAAPAVDASQLSFNLGDILTKLPTLQAIAQAPVAEPAQEPASGLAEGNQGPGIAPVVAATVAASRRRKGATAPRDEEQAWDIISQPLSKNAQFTDLMVSQLQEAGFTSLLDLLMWYPRKYKLLSHSVAPGASDKGAALTVTVANVESPFLIKKGSMAMLNVLLRVENTGQHIAMLETAFGFAHWPLTQLAKRRKELLAMKDERLLVGTVQASGGSRAPFECKDGKLVAEGPAGAWARQVLGLETPLDPALDTGLVSEEGLSLLPHYRARKPVKGTEFFSVEAKKKLYMERALRALTSISGWESSLAGLSSTVLPHLLPWHTAIRAIHAPRGEAHCDLARKSLAYHELVLLQLRLLQRRKAFITATDGRRPCQPVIHTPAVSAAVKALDFTLTNDQQRVFSEMMSDMKGPHTMFRLLQGDVGSGKTIVAMLAMIATAATGSQALLLAPTEILAQQHHEKFVALVKKLPKKTQQEVLGKDMTMPVLLTGSLKPSERRKAHALIQSGKARLVVSTHAVFWTEDWHSLALAVIDEQHKFGLAQKKRLLELSASVHPHILSMSATPIPRTMALALYGDMEISVIQERPPGRLPVETVTYFDDEQGHAAMVHAVLKEVEAGNRAFITYPAVGLHDSDSDSDSDSDGSDSAPGKGKKRKKTAAKKKTAKSSAKASKKSKEPPTGSVKEGLDEDDIEEEEEDALKACVDDYERFTKTKVFGKHKCVLLHGRMYSDDKEKAIAQIRSGSHPIMFCTSVVEVGVDVPEATIMVVQQADRFGLAQLHQMRGRVGRSERPSKCVLLTSNQNMDALIRLKTLETCHDGLEIAERDLVFRGAGSMFSSNTRQSGTPDCSALCTEQMFKSPEIVLAAREAATKALSDGLTPEVVAAMNAFSKRAGQTIDITPLGSTPLGQAH